MPSGKKSKQIRRAAAVAPPPVVSKGGTRRRQANPRVLAIAAAVVALAGIGIGLAIALSGGSKTAIPKDIPTFGSIANGLPGSAEVAAMYKGIPQKGLVLGSEFAPSQMVIYIDLQCPLCKEFETTETPTLLSKYVRTGKLRIEVKPWAFIGPDSTRGQKAMLAAAKQNKAFNFAQILYVNQGTENTGWLTDNMVYQAAVSVPGLNVPQLLTERSSSSVSGQTKDVAAAALANKVNGTPTVFVGKSGSAPKVVGDPGLVPTLQQVEAAIQAALA